MKIRLDVVTPDRRVVELEADEVTLPSVEGSMGVLPGHAPLLAMLQPGEVSYRNGSQRKFLAVAGGFAEVLRESVSIMSDAAELAEEIDVERARRAKAEAEKEIARAQDAQFRIAEARLKRAMTRIRVAEHARS